MKIIPTENNVVVSMIKKPQKSHSGIIIPISSDDLHYKTRAQIICTSDKEDYFKEGDLVIVDSRFADEIEEEPDLLIVERNKILAVIKE